MSFDFGALIRDLRLRANLTATEACQSLGKPESHLSKLETGRTEMPDRGDFVTGLFRLYFDSFKAKDRDHLDDPVRSAEMVFQAWELHEFLRRPSKLAEASDSKAEAAYAAILLAGRRFRILSLHSVPPPSTTSQAPEVLKHRWFWTSRVAYPPGTQWANAALYGLGAEPSNKLIRFEATYPYPDRLPPHVYAGAKAPRHLSAVYLVVDELITFVHNGFFLDVTVNPQFTRDVEAVFKTDSQSFSPE